MKFQEKVSSNIKKEFDSEHVYNEKYLKTKIKSYKRKINANLYSNKIPKGSQCICLSVTLIDSVFRTSKNYNPQDECKKNVNMLLKEK